MRKSHGYLIVSFYHFSMVQFVDDVEFWFPPGNKPLVQYRSASRSGFIDFSANKKRVKVCLLLSGTVCVI